MTSAMLTGSTVGVIAAATKAMPTNAYFHCFSITCGETMPSHATIAMISGVSKATPIHRSTASTNEK